MNKDLADGLGLAAVIFATFAGIALVILALD